MRNVKEKYEKAFDGLRAPDSLKQKTLRAMRKDKSPAPQKAPHRLLKSLAAGTVCAAFLCGMIVVPQIASQPKGNSFQIVAYAADNKKVPLKKGENISISRVKQGEGNDWGLIDYQLLQDHYDYLDVGVYCDLQLICEGDNIKTITYSTEDENITFGKMIFMSQEEWRKVENTSPLSKGDWELEENATAKRHEEQGESYEKRPYPYEDSVNPNYGDGHSVEAAGRGVIVNLGEPDEREVFFAVLPVGKDYTVEYEDQEKGEYRWALRATAIQETRVDHRRRWAMNDFSYLDAIAAIDGTKLKVTVTYEDDTTETKEIQVRYHTALTEDHQEMYYTDVYLVEL